MEASFTEDQRMIREAAVAFAQERLAPKAGLIEEDDAALAALLRETGESGFFGMCLPEDSGGIGADTTGFVLAVEEISKVSASIGAYLVVNNAVIGEMLRHGGDGDMARSWLDKLTAGGGTGAFAGSVSHPASHFTVAPGDENGYRLNGNVLAVLGAGMADFFVIHARSPDDGERDALLLVPRSMDGLHIGDRQTPIGLRAAAPAPVACLDCLVPEAHLLGAYGEAAVLLESVAGFADVGVAALSLGLAGAAYAEARAYAGARKQFGQPIHAFEAVAFMLAGMETDIEATRGLVYDAARQRDRGDACRIPPARARLHAVGMVNRVADAALQIHGGYGYMKEYPVERHFRDARMLAALDGTTDTQKRVIAGALMGEWANDSNAECGVRNRNSIR